ncbi:MAG TPA: hypothetical protein ACFYD6_08285 [Candidatus Brocadiia bacterium]|nr:hypothetical protein [Planctomycetota bacterium]MDO8094495.1 hypothetical protein [Candidatus Brocadiales bacterium]
MVLTKRHPFTTQGIGLKNKKTTKTINGLCGLKHVFIMCIQKQTANGLTASVYYASIITEKARLSSKKNAAPIIKGIEGG